MVNIDQEQISIFDILDRKKSKVLDLYEKLLTKSLKKTMWWHKDYVYNQKFMCAVCGKTKLKSRTLEISGPTNYDWQDKDKVYYSYDIWGENGGTNGATTEDEIIKMLQSRINNKIMIADCGKLHYLKYWRKGLDSHERWTDQVGKYLKLKLSRKEKYEETN